MVFESRWSTTFSKTLRNGSDRDALKREEHQGERECMISSWSTAKARLTAHGDGDIKGCFLYNSSPACTGFLCDEATAMQRQTKAVLRRKPKQTSLTQSSVMPSQLMDVIEHRPTNDNAESDQFLDEN